MYGNWERWNERRRLKYGSSVSEGIAGSNIIMKKTALEKIGLWDERIQAADTDIYIRAMVRSKEQGDLKPLQLLHGVYLHHFVRLTCKIKFPRFVDNDTIIQTNQKWDPEKINPLIASCGIKLKPAKESCNKQLVNTIVNTSEAGIASDTSIF
jgi:hypothetical protein